MKRITLITIVGVLMSIDTFAQQIPLYSQYYLNQFLYNPARTGDRGNLHANLIYRKQWTDVVGAPETKAVTLDGSIQDNKAGFGGMVYQDNISFFRKTGGYLSYAYSFNFKEHHRFSIGIAAGINETSINRSQVRPENENEPVLNNFNRGIGFDGSAGINYRFKGLNVGFSMPQLFKTNLSYLNNNDTPLNYQLSRHYLVNASYNITLKKDVLSLEPGAFFRLSEGGQFQVDVNAKLMYKNLVWVGLMYRYNYAVTAGVGFQVHDRISIGYASDFAVNDLSRQAGGTHEVFMGIKFGKSEDKGLIETLKQLQQRQDLLDSKLDDVAATNDSLKSANEELKETVAKKDKEIEDLKAEMEKKLRDFQESMKNQSPPVNVELPKESVYSGKKEDLEFIDGDPGTGYFMVVAATKTEKGARQEQQMYKGKGHDVGIVLNKRKSWYYLYLSKEGDFDQGIKDLYKLRENSEFKDAWIHIYK
jgi:type IX secretion system PorP/SprF family membrane protein